jgi:hypothetical protein
MEPRLRETSEDRRKKGKKAQGFGKGVAGIPTVYRFPEGAGKSIHDLLLFDA